MSAESPCEIVNFITTQDGDDLVVSFAIATGVPGDVVSLTLIRTPKFEFGLPEEDRGVCVWHECIPETDVLEHLQRIRVAPPVVSIATTQRFYELDVSKVEPDELHSAQQVLEQMNFDKRFVLRLR